MHGRIENKVNLTVAFPVYERKEYFENALLSVLNQTTKCDIIVLDNCSSHDYFRNICNKYNVKYFRNDENIGLFPNWNKCMSLVETKYGMIFQDDNIMSPNFVEEFEKNLNQYPDIDLYFTDFEILNLDTKIKNKHKHNFPFGYMKNGNEVIEYGIKEKLGFPYAFVIKSELFTPYYFECHGSNDWLWVYENIKPFATFGNDKPLFLYGAHPNQDSRSLDTHVKCMISISFIYKVILKSKVDNSALKNLAEQRFLNVFFYFLAVSSSGFIKSLKNENHKYALFYRDIISKYFLFKFFSELPYVLRNSIYKIFRKLFSFSI